MRWRRFSTSLRTSCDAVRRLLVLGVAMVFYLVCPTSLDV
jgi:hypothetical protein